MSAPTNPPPGLRERKKIKLRRAIQTAALRLFETQGYEHTTVEQIAEAAETSTTTFYRYFPTKEDVVLDNDASPLFEATVATRPAGEPLTATIRAAMAAVVAAAEADRDQTLARMRLVATVPALGARYAGEERRTIDLLTRLLASRTGRPADDYQLELIAFVLAAVLFTASRRWVAEQGATPLAVLVGQAVTTIEPLLAALEVAGPVAGPEPFADPLGDAAAGQVRGEPAGRGDPLGLGVPVSDDDRALQAEQRGPAVGLRVHPPGQLAQRPPLEEGPEPGRLGALERGPHQPGGEAARAFDGLECDVAGEAVGHHHVHLAGQQVAALDVAGEADRQAPVRRRGQQLVCPAGELVALGRLGADGEQAHPRVLYAVGHLRVGDAEVGELDQHLRPGVGDGAGVH